MSQEQKENETLRRGAVDGCAYSTVDKNGVEFFYGVATSNGVGNAREQTFDAFRRLDAALARADFAGRVVKLNVFLREIGDKELVRAVLRKFWGPENVPATTFIPQKACDGRLALILEATAIRSSGSDAAVKTTRRGEHATLVEFADVELGFFGGFGPGDEPVGAYERSFDAFCRMRGAVEANGFLTPQIFRTWIYQGNIVLEEGETQRYKELNRARSDFFYGIRFLERYLPKDVPLGAIYPASTGIGGDDVDVAISCQTIKTERPDALVSPLENPNQTPAFDYAEFYSPKSPKFSRAVAVSFNGRCAVYVSGTASIVDQRTVHIGDPAAQAEQTLDNIAALIAGENLEKHGIAGFDSGLSDLAVARVYVKRPEYFDAIRSVCEKRLASVPTIYTFADVCRDDLLVEIEGIVACIPTK